MSTRAQIAVVDEHSFQLFYQHSDGYPKGVLPTLQRFLGEVKEGRIRDNVGQSSGWLIVWGHQEMVEFYKEMQEELGSSEDTYESMMGWKASFIEPSPEGIHGDIEYFYIVDLEQKKIFYTDDIDNILNNWVPYTTKAEDFQHVRVGRWAEIS